jgi:hypothetical protein
MSSMDTMDGKKWWGEENYFIHSLAFNTQNYIFIDWLYDIHNTHSTTTAAILKTYL